MWSLEYSTEFVSWAMHLAHRGIVCLLPEYRTHASYNVSAEDIIGDGLDAWKWLHHNAAGVGRVNDTSQNTGTAGIYGNGRKHTQQYYDAQQYTYESLLCKHNENLPQNEMLISVYHAFSKMQREACRQAGKTRGS
jgi:hypothetical protein